MVVLIRKKQRIMGEEVELSQYFPSDIPLTRERREKANLLDKEIKDLVGIINNKYEKLNNLLKKDDFKKWKWLGEEINYLIKSLVNLDRADIDNYVIWPALGQYFREELRRGFDAKRSGTKKDHYRKCSILASYPDTDWFVSWSGWDAFIDRGEQLVLTGKIIPKLKIKFLNYKDKLTPRDYQIIAKMIVELIPAGSNGSIDISEMSDQEITKVINSVYEKFKIL